MWGMGRTPKRSFLSIGPEQRGEQRAKRRAKRRPAWISVAAPTAAAAHGRSIGAGCWGRERLQGTDLLPGMREALRYHSHIFTQGDHCEVPGQPGGKKRRTQVMVALQGRPWIMFSRAEGFLVS